MKKQLKMASVFVLFALLSQVFVGFVFAQEFPQAPSEVQKVLAIAGNGEITLSWDEALDADGVVNEYKVYYGTKSVQTAEDMYTEEVTAQVGMLSHTVTGLENGTQYFFAITAVDDEQIESDTYSVEVSAIPVAPMAPYMQLISVKQSWNNEVQVVLSEDVFFEGDPRPAFIISAKDDEVELMIREAQVKEDQVILIMAEDLIPGKLYQVVATDGVQTSEGQGTELGVMDRAEFVATQFAEDPVGPQDSKETGTSGDPFGSVPESGEAGMTTGAVGGSDKTVEVVADVQNLALDASLLKSERIMLLDWTLAETPNIADQVIFTRQGLEDWDTGYSLGIDLTQIELSVSMDKNYEIKLVTINEAGDESEGVTLSFSTSLTETGPGTIGSVIALVLIFMMGLLFFKKKQTC